MKPTVLDCLIEDARGAEPLCNSEYNSTVLKMQEEVFKSWENLH